MATSTDSRRSGRLGRLRERATGPGMLLVPLVIYELLFFIAPLAYLFRISLMKPATGQAYISGTFTLANYTQVLFSSRFQEIIFFSLKYGVLVTVLTVIVGTYYAYAIWQADGLLGTALLFVVLITLLTTLVVRLFAVFVLFSPTGAASNLINQAMLAINVFNQPHLFVTNLFGATVGQMYVMFPYVVLPVYSVLVTLDEQRVEAARDLGATEFQSFREVVLPQAIPGIMVGAILSFAWSFGAYAAPFLLGSTNTETAAMEVYRLMVGRFNWPLATALAFVVLAVVLISVGAVFYVFRNSLGDVYAA